MGKHQEKEGGEQVVIEEGDGVFGVEFELLLGFFCGLLVFFEGLVKFLLFFVFFVVHFFEGFGVPVAEFDD